MPWFLFVALAFAAGFVVGRMTAGGRNVASLPAAPAGPPPWEAFPQSNAAPAEAFSPFNAAPTGPFAPLGPTPGGATPAFQIWLADGGPNAINTIKAVREVTRLGLKDAKDLHDRVPSALVRVSGQAEVDRIQRIFQNVARLEVRQVQ